MKDLNNKIVAIAGTLLLGVAGWVLSTTLSIQQEIIEIRIKTENIESTIDKVYAENCPYCVHAAHSGIQEHPLLSPTIKHSHRHIGDTIVKINE